MKFLRCAATVKPLMDKPGRYMTISRAGMCIYELCLGRAFFMSKKYFYSLVIAAIVSLPFFIHEERLFRVDEVAGVGKSYAKLQAVEVVSTNTPVTIKCGAGHVVYECMQQQDATTNFSFKGRTFPSLGFFVDEINGQKNAKGFYWTLYVNGVYSTVGASQYVVKTGDVIEWKYEKK